MTAPPGGPYGPDPNQYGQQPYWGGQPQGGQYPYPPPGPYPGPQGTDPYGAAPSPPQQYPQPGQQYPPGWPPGQYPPGPPPKPPGSKVPWLILAGVAVVGVIALVIVLVVVLNHRDSSTTAGSPGSSPTTSAPTSQPNGSEQTATDCTPNVSGGDKPDDGTISAGKLSFPASVAAGWAPFSDDQSPNLIDAVGVGQEVPGASQWMMQAEVAITNFVSSMDVSKQASKLMQCVASGPGYSQSQPTLGPTKTSSMTVDGVKAARVDADITIGDTSRHVKGDTVTIIAVDTKPVTIFMGATPIGDAGSAATIGKVIAALKVSKS
ncbi:hypothetical protein B1T47_20890 [Mycobacterium kansasii]|uniref:hypothetical protein n=1 Tax=Mycobacterium kansasii TaxID=1768 RepID=UPI0009EF7819|nr:hypothetical protein [Mycobacterium kansasii]ARG71081.1 hypothetical protein B1T47_20890 [Mycobacterium kansasii]ORC10746.1 hypothetical protein B1T46_07945 [Mycobacterium kansasii]